MDITGKIAIITGAGSGLGAETARFLAKKGANLALLDINSAAVNAVAAKTNGMAFCLDVADETALTQAFHEIRAARGIPRICINCAGIAPAARILPREGVMPLADFRQVIDSNLIGTFNTLRLAAKHMLESQEDDERGVIINTASIAAFEGQIGQVAYSAAKGAIVALTLPAARELAQHAIRVMTIAPGVMETPMMSGMAESVRDKLILQIPYPKRLGKPEEYARLVGHIIENPLLNGAVIRLDGGLRM